MTKADRGGAHHPLVELTLTRLREFVREPEALFWTFVFPIVIGGGKRTLPDNVRVQLELLDERRFDNGVVHLHYRVRA